MNSPSSTTNSGLAMRALTAHNQCWQVVEMGDVGAHLPLSAERTSGRQWSLAPSPFQYCGEYELGCIVKKPYVQGGKIAESKNQVVGCPYSEQKNQGHRPSSPEIPPQLKKLPSSYVY